MSRFTKDSLLRHAEQYPHDVEGYVVPCMRKMVQAGFPKDASKLAELIIQQNHSLTYLMVEFMSDIVRACEKYRYMDKRGDPRPTMQSIAVIYNRYH